MTQKMQNRCTVVLKQDDYCTQKTYRISKRLFYLLEKNLEKYRSTQQATKRIRCVETGQIFESARKAGEWVRFALEINYCDFRLIKQACYRTKGKSYGYHWEFVKQTKMKQ